jgi:predicted ester cyclase
MEVDVTGERHEGQDLREEHKRIVRRYYEEVFARRNLAALEELFAPEFVGHSAAYGTFTLADMRRDIAREHEDMPDDETILEDQLAEGDRVVTRWRYRWKHDRSLFGEPPSGEWVEMAGVQIDRLAAGKIVERWEVKDFWGVVTSLGGKAAFVGGRPAGG